MVLQVDAGVWAPAEKEVCPISLQRAERDSALHGSPEEEMPGQKWRE